MRDRRGPSCAPTPAPIPSAGTFACSDPRLERLFEAGRETFRQNALDIFMDCPEPRAGRLAVRQLLHLARGGRPAGESRVERNFFENFLLPESFEHLARRACCRCATRRTTPIGNVHPELGDVVRGGVGGISRAHRRPGDGGRAGAEGAGAAGFPRAVSQLRRPAGEVAELGVHRVVEVQRLRAGRELSQQHALCGNARRGGPAV